MRHILDTFPFRLQPTQQVFSSPAPRCQQLRLHMFLSDSHQCCAAVLQLRFMISHFVPLCQLRDPAYVRACVCVCVCACEYIYVLSAPWVCSCCHTCSRWVESCQSRCWSDSGNFWKATCAPSSDSRLWHQTCGKPGATEYNTRTIPGTDGPGRRGPFTHEENLF